MGTWIKDHIIYLAWITAVIAMSTSLYFHFIQHFEACELCWFQRILLYPLVIILTVGIWKKDRNLAFYVLPFSILGIVLSIYHYMIQQNFINVSEIACNLCHTMYLSLFNFVTIPFLSLISFVIITIATVFYHKNLRTNQ